MRLLLLTLIGAVIAFDGLKATGFAPYFSYTGSLAVVGTVGPMTTTGAGSGLRQTFAYLLADGRRSRVLGWRRRGSQFVWHARPQRQVVRVGRRRPPRYGDRPGGRPVGGGDLHIDGRLDERLLGTHLRGASESDLSGRTFIIQESASARIACALLLLAGTYVFMCRGK